MSRRILALWLPSLPTDRVHRQGGVEGGRPLVTVTGDRGRRIVTGVDDAAAAAGLFPGMPLADARALEPGMQAVPADPEADSRALRDLACWCGRYTPWAAPHGGDGILLDITGCAHLFGGEADLARDLSARLGRLGFLSRLAVADTAGAAWAIARVGSGHGWRGGALEAAVITPGRSREAIAPLPVAGLRLDAATVAALERAGLSRIGDVQALPRGPLATRFGRRLLQRLDQASGAEAEAISPLKPVARYRARLAFAEPIGRTEDVEAALDRLLGLLCRDLEQAGLGVRRAELTLYRVDGAVARRSIGTSVPMRQPAGLFRLFRDRLEGLDAGFGIEVAVLSADAVEPMAPSQPALDQAAAERGGRALAELADRLALRLGQGAVFRPAVRESHWPDRAVARQAAVAAPSAETWPADTPRPLRLLAQPQPIEAMAPVPDDPPILFRWQGRHHRVARADGPERIAHEWWQDAPRRPARDYYHVEDADGRRFWLYRDGPYDPERPCRWYLHGLFA